MVPHHTGMRFSVSNRVPASPTAAVYSAQIESALSVSTNAAAKVAVHPRKWAEISRRAHLLPARNSFLSLDRLSTVCYLNELCTLSVFVIDGFSTSTCGWQSRQCVHCMMNDTGAMYGVKYKLWNAKSPSWPTYWPFFQIRNPSEFLMVSSDGKMTASNVRPQ